MSLRTQKSNLMPDCLVGLTNYGGKKTSRYLVEVDIIYGVFCRVLWSVIVFLFYDIFHVMVKQIVMCRFNI